MPHHHNVHPAPRGPYAHFSERPRVSSSPIDHRLLLTLLAQRPQPRPSERVVYQPLLPLFEQAEREYDEEQRERQDLAGELDQMIANFPTAADSSNSSSSVVQRGFFSVASAPASPSPSDSETESNTSSPSSPKS